MTAVSANKIISGSPAQRRLISREFDTADIIRVILYADKQSRQFVLPAATRRLEGRNDYQTLENIYWLVKRNVDYQGDPRGREEVRSPGYLFQTGQGDCKSMSIAIGALCRAFGIPYQYRFVRQSGQPNYHHVYVVAQVRDGSANREVILDAVHHTFDAQPRYVKKLDLKPGAKVPAHVAGFETAGSGAVLMGIILIWFLFAKKVRK